MILRSFWKNLLSIETQLQKSCQPSLAAFLLHQHKGALPLGRAGMMEEMGYADF
jgi:hypothetical protein